MEKGKSEECRKCANLKAIGVYMDGKVKYGCGKVPVYVKPCKAFKDREKVEEDLTGGRV